ncbi:TetR/AcrR family transcriptional regulator [Nocardiopsis gilva YIM 90087]|uniref:TetR/AcrR family transcriptional regulator n=1 Tax=Nocardiopsis gilva YIM 90087 TaxID=1235441 RepID=A0A223S1T6_9ACTN|nr:TetR/AcrR family transcriptional regulator [Nocardiopsis gilva]ASU82086.1 TetR/AcrR family transcriptional regulator [Nocardiopsis gilva YIM 90087]
MGRPREFDDTAAVAAAMEVFWSKGYEATSTGDLCEGTGLGRGSLYNAFGNKQRLYEEALRRYTQDGFQAQLELLDGPGTAKDRLRRLMTQVIDIDMDDPQRRGCMAINAAVEPAGRDDAVARLADRSFKRLEDAIHDVIVVGQRLGEISADRDPRQAARCVLSAYYGLRVLGKVSQDRSALDDIVEGTLATL